jgi:hypothetical protein
MGNSVTPASLGSQFLISGRLSVPPAGLGADQGQLGRGGEKRRGPVRGAGVFQLAERGEQARAIGLDRGAFSAEGRVRAIMGGEWQWLTSRGRTLPSASSRQRAS